MADFTQGINPVSTPTMSVASPAVDMSTANAVSSFGNIGGVIGATLMNAREGALKAQVTTAQNDRMASYTDNMMRVADLAAQGTLTPNQAASHFRLMTARALANNTTEEAQKRVFEIAKNIMGGAGLGKGVIDDIDRKKTDDAAAKQQARLDAQKEGYISPTDSEEQQDAGVAVHQRVLLARSQLADADRVLTHKTNEIGLTNARLETISKRQSIATGAINQRSAQLNYSEALAKHNYWQSASTIADANFGRVQKTFATLADQVKSGEKTADQAMSEIDQIQAAAHQAAASAASRVGIDQLPALVKPSDDLANSFKDMISGKITADVYKNQVETAVAKQQHVTLSNNPDLANDIAVVKLIPNMPMSPQISNHIFKALSPNNPSSSIDVTNNNDDTKAAANKVLFKTVRNGVSNINSGLNDPEVKAQVHTAVTKIVSGVGKYGPTVASPQELTDVVSFIGSSQMREYFKKNPEIMSGQDGVMAKNVYKMYYESVVLPIYQQEYKDGKFNIGGSPDNKGPKLGTQVGIGSGLTTPVMKPTGQYIEQQFNGTGVTFVPKTKDLEVQRQAKKLNRELAPVVNNLISAHMSFDMVSAKEAYDTLMTSAEMQPTKVDTKGND